MRILRINNAYDIVIDEKVNMGVTFQISDVRNPETRSSAYSKTIAVPSNKDIDKYFGFIFDMQSELGQTTFSPNKKTPAKILDNDTVVIDGYARLISIDNDFGKITYNIGVFGTLVNLFQDMGDDYIDEVIDTLLSPITPNLATYITTWITSTSPYYFTPINQNANRNQDTNFQLTDFKISWNFRYLFIKILQNYGYTYTSNFVNYALELDDLYVYLAPIVRELTAEEAENRKCLLQQSGSTQYTIIDNDTGIDSRRSKGFYGVQQGYYGATLTTFYYYDCFEGTKELQLNDTQDNFNQFSGGRFRPIIGGKHKLIIDLQIGAFEASTFGGATYTAIDEYYLELWGDRNGLSNKFAEYKLIPTTNTDGNETLQLETYFYPILERAYYFKIRFKTIGKPILQVTGLTPAEVAAITAHQTDTMITPAWCNVTACNITIEPSSVASSSGTYFPNEKLPHIKCKDLVFAMVKMFNLMIDVDKEDPKNLLIAPYVDFYNQGTLDWSSKLCRDKPIQITPLAEVTNKELVYKYKLDKDFFAESYKEENFYTYGESRIEILNDFAKGVSTTEIPFALTPPADFKSVGLPFTNLFDLSNNPINTEIARVGYKVLIATHITIGTTANAYFPAFMDAKSDTSLCFQTPKKVYYTGQLASQYPNDNLFTKFYAPQLSEYADPTSRLLIAYFNLNEFDIHTFSFQKNVLVDNVLYRVNKIDGYNGSGDYTKVELLKVINATVEALPPSDLNQGTQVVDIVDGGLNIVYAPYRYLNVDVFDGLQNGIIGTTFINDLTSIDGGRS